jgi:hypothetical protein
MEEKAIECDLPFSSGRRDFLKGGSRHAPWDPRSQRS